MKILLSGLLLVSTLAANAQKNFEIQGKINDPLEKKVYLSIFPTAEGKQTVYDSAILKNGNFTFKGKVDELSNAAISFQKMGGGRVENYLYFYLAPEKIKMEGYGKELKKMTISNSKINADNASLKKLLEPIDNWYESFDKSYEKAVKEKDQALIKKLDDEEHQKDLEKRAIVAQFVMKNGSSQLSPKAILNNFGYYADVNDVQPLYNALSAKNKQSKDGKEIAKMIESYKKVTIGAQPSISQADSNGVMHNLLELRGNYVLVDFWASWCGPCRRENSNIVAAYGDYHNKGFEVFGVSYDNNKEKWTKAIVKDGLVWTNISDLKGWQNATSEEFYIKAIPTNLLLDRNGKVIAKNLFGDELKAKLAELMP